MSPPRRWSSITVAWARAARALHLRVSAGALQLGGHCEDSDHDIVCGGHSRESTEEIRYRRGCAST